MADNSIQASKKSGFSFRKRRSNSKTRKGDDAKLVDIETDERINESEMATNGEHSATEGGDSPTTKAVQTETPEVEADEGAEVGTPSSGEDSSPKGVKSDESPEGTIKKKSKRRPRSLFRRNSKNKDAKNVEKVEDACQNATKESETQEEAVEVKASDPCMNDTKEQVVCDESEKRNEIREQSDAECAGNVSGEASEAEGEVLGEKNEEENEQAKEFTNGTAEEPTGDEKKEEEKQGTKRKGFFKRGLSLRRSKSKKSSQDGGESKAEKPTTKEVETCDIAVPADSILEQSPVATQSDSNEINNGESPSDIKEKNEANSSEIPEEAKTEGSEHTNVSAIAKKSLAKPIRKVSFVEPEYAKVESSVEGDSPSEEETETGKDFQDATPPSTSETAPSEEASVDSEAAAELKYIGYTENPKTEVDDDDLTEVSSVTSSFLVSSDAPSQVDAEEAQPFVFADTEETGSRITLVESGEIGEGSESKPEVDEKQSAKDALEDDKLLEDVPMEKKDGEWVMLNQSYDMSVELQRVRKQTLFSVKRLCCSVM